MNVFPLVYNPQWSRSQHWEEALGYDSALNFIKEGKQKKRLL